MKLAYLLAQYLYTHKRLDLPGIGTFTLDPSVIIDSDHSRHKNTMPEGIGFKSDPSIREVPELISYISSQTGKMKALAISDVESHLELVHQFLNIGKPFTFEGIGSLVKIRPGEFEFTPGAIITDKAKEIAQKEVHGLSKKESTDAKYQAFLATPAVKSRWKKPVAVLLAVCGLGLAIWGGYTIATRNAQGDASVSDVTTETATQVVDSSQLIKPDSLTTPPKAVANRYKYILEETNGNRAYKRFNQLKQTNLANLIQLETKDSVRYKLFIMLPVSSDTTRIIDSLTIFLGRKVYIEHQN
ncbi:MAG: hypothetical protein JNK14_12820 [Chitinophagaceae bacterium]|nr:hypothetical protein [Chitinophagaceae bacterium]